MRLLSIDKLGLGHAHNAAIIDLVLPSYSRRSYYQTFYRLTMSSFKLQKHTPHSQAQPYFSNTTTIEFLSTSHGVRTEYPSDRTYGIYLFPVSSYQICHSGRTRVCQHSRTSVSILPRTLRLNIKAITTPVFNIQLMFFLLGYPFITTSMIWMLFCSAPVSRFPNPFSFLLFLL